MRNGNYFITPHITLSCFVLILPMRNGNYFQSSEIIFTSSSSYPTYEEWKRVIDDNGKKKDMCSYPTYEEWKLLNEHIV